jgi:hypothetical protein
MKEYLELVDVLGCEGPGFTAMKNGVDRNIAKKISFLVNRSTAC